jgi:hypothetical protein
MPDARVEREARARVNVVSIFGGAPYADFTAMSTAIDSLVSLQRDELAAVASYRRALLRLHDPDARDELKAAAGAHEARAGTLARRIEELGGQPATSPSVVGAALVLLERLASFLGDRVAVTVLEEEEHRAVARYRREIDHLDPESLALVAGRLLPAQERTRCALSTLRMALH